MKIIALAFTKNGGKIARLLKDKLNADGYIVKTHSRDGLKSFDNLVETVQRAWQNYNAVIFVGAAGIAVRAIAPYIKNKAEDPAVVVVDDLGQYAIPILSGHIGGANELAKKIAEITGGQAVITTATDINEKFSVDTFAVKNNLYTGDTKLIKEISSRALEDKKIGLYSDYELKNIPDCFTDNAEAGICISDTEKKPFPITLNLFPKNVIIGIGCKKGKETVEDSLHKFLKTNGIMPRSVTAVATIDIKKDEKGITDFCEKYSLPLLTFTAEELNAIDGEFTASEFVLETVGVDNVCERAVCAAGATLTHRKTALNGVTVAAGKTDITIDFEGH